MTYPVHFRKKVLAEAETAERVTDVLKRYGLSPSVFYRWKKNLNPKTKREKGAVSISDEQLQDDVARFPDATQQERASRLGCSQAGICYALRRLGISRKKNSASSPGRRSAKG